MTTLIDVIPLIVGNSDNEYEHLILLIFSGIIGTICIMFFLKLFLLIGGYISPKNR